MLPPHIVVDGLHKLLALGMTYRKLRAAQIDGISVYALYVREIYKVTAVAPRKTARIEFFFHLFERAIRLEIPARRVIHYFVREYLHVNYFGQFYFNDGIVKLYFGLRVSRPLEPRQRSAQLEIEHSVLERLNDEIERIHLVPAHRELRKIGHKDQNNVGIYRTQFDRRVETVYIRHLYVHKNYVVNGSVISKEAYRVIEPNNIEKMRPPPPRLAAAYLDSISDSSSAADFSSSTIAIRIIISPIDYYTVRAFVSNKHA